MPDYCEELSNGFVVRRMPRSTWEHRGHNYIGNVLPIDWVYERIESMSTDKLIRIKSAIEKRLSLGIGITQRQAMIHKAVIAAILSHEREKDV